MLGQQRNIHGLASRQAANSNAKAPVSAASRSIRCARCGHKGVRRCGAQDILASLAHQTGFELYRCRACFASYFEER